MPVTGSGVILGASEFAERRFDGAAAGKIVTAAGQRVAGRAIADDGKIVAALDLIEILLIDAGRDRAARAASTKRCAKQQRSAIIAAQSVRPSRMDKRARIFEILRTDRCGRPESERATVPVGL